MVFSTALAQRSSTLSKGRNAASARKGAKLQRKLRAAHLACRAETEAPPSSSDSKPEATTVSAGEAPNAEKPTTTAPEADGNWVPVLAPEDLPKGVRKEVSVNGTAVLLFWYRNQIYAIAARSPAEGAYSEGFIKAKFTQDFGIICPQTGSIFSLKDGSIVEWYPANPVLRSITPPSGNLPIYPVKLTQDAIKVDVASVASSLAATRGGADTSLENNNVFALQPSVYLSGSERDEGPGVGGGLSTAVTLTAAITAFAVIATAGTATALYYEDFILLGGFWALMLGAGGYFAFQYNQSRKA